jgi:hypothetical protein
MLNFSDLSFLILFKTKLRIKTVFKEEVYPERTYENVTERWRHPPRQRYILYILYSIDEAVA